MFRLSFRLGLMLRFWLKVNIWLILRLELKCLGSGFGLGFVLALILLATLGTSRSFFELHLILD